MYLFKGIYIYINSESIRNISWHLRLIVLLTISLAISGTASALSPPDLNTNIPWDEDSQVAGNQATYANVGAIQSAFTNARRQEEIQLMLTTNSLGNMTLPSQASWDALSLADKALLITNSERVARGGVTYPSGTPLGLPLEAVELNINTLSQDYANYMVANNFWDHNAPANGPAPFAGTSPFSRIDNHAVIGNGVGTNGGNCHQFLGGAENLGVFASSPGTTIPMPVERAIYGFIYNDASSAWGHRHLMLLQDQSLTGGAGFTNDVGSAGSEGYLGIGTAGVTDGSYTIFNPVNFPVQQNVVFMVFDPVPDAACNYNVQGGGPPAQATQISPTGTSATATPTYTWNAVANSIWYYLWVNDNTGTPIKQWITAANANCGTGTGQCSFTPTAAVAGSVTWWIQTWNSTASGPWSAGLTFTVTGTPPTQATLVSPTGTSTTATPTYTWNAVTNSTWYYLWANDSTGTPIKQWITAANANCGAGTGQCSFTPTTAVAGSVTWWIQTWNTSAAGPWSAGLTFTVAGAPPGQATLISPNGAGSGTTPTYIWNAVANSTWYYLWVNDSTGTPIKQWITAANANCGAGTGQCSFAPTTAVAGSATWWVQTWNSSSTGSWSTALNFTP